MYAMLLYDRVAEPKLSVCASTTQLTSLVMCTHKGVVSACTRCFCMIECLSPSSLCAHPLRC
jgi:hypothetical protein